MTAPTFRRYRLVAGQLALLLAVGTAAGTTAEAQTADEQVAEVFREIRLFQLLDKADSSFRPRFRTFFMQLLEKGPTPDEARAAGVAWGREAMGPYLTKYLPRATDSTVVAFAQSFVPVLEHLSRSSPEGCINLLFGGGGNAPTRTPPELETRLLRVTEQVIAEGLDRPAPVIDTAAANATVMTVITRLQEEHGDSVLADLQRIADPVALRQEPARACRATAAMYSVAVAMPVDSAGPMLRFLFSAAR